MAFIVFGAWLAQLYPNRLEKSMFLCPMTQKDRKEYLVTAYGLRVIYITYGFHKSVFGGGYGKA